MKLWHISQGVNTEYDTYDSAVVAAETEDEARRTYPGGEGYVHYNKAGILTESDDEIVVEWSAWASDIKDVAVAYLGEAAEGTVSGVICASYNAG